MTRRLGREAIGVSLWAAARCVESARRVKAVHVRHTGSSMIIMFVVIISSRTGRQQQHVIVASSSPSTHDTNPSPGPSPHASPRSQGLCRLLFRRRRPPCAATDQFPPLLYHVMASVQVEIHIKGTLPHPPPPATDTPSPALPSLLPKLCRTFAACFSDADSPNPLPPAVSDLLQHIQASVVGGSGLAHGSVFHSLAIQGKYKCEQGE